MGAVHASRRGLPGDFTIGFQIAVDVVPDPGRARRVGHGPERARTAQSGRRLLGGSAHNMAPSVRLPKRAKAPTCV